MNVARVVFRLLLGSRLPVTSGELRVAGIAAPVTIRRDRHGIPHIQAESGQDAWYGLGFCQGQDRAFQLETLLRVVRGTLAELIGHEGLGVDRLSRRIGFRRAALRQLPALDDDIRAMVEAFARGVTDGAARGCRRRAHEFALLRSAPTPFEAADVLGAIKVQSFAMASNWDSELARLKILTLDGAEAVAALDPTYPEGHPVSSPVTAEAGAAADRLAEDVSLLGRSIGLGGMSNNWAVAASRSATGRPLLANDPHLPPSLPPHWYLAHVQTRDWAVAGASFVGAPGIIAGHNGQGSWGITAGLVDNTDLFLEEVGPDGRGVRSGAGFVPCEVVPEVIAVKGGRPVREDVLVTPRGPIVSPALRADDHAISIRAVWLEPRPLRGPLSAHLAGTFEEFRGAFAHWPVLPLNVVYADTPGTIGWQLVGEAPHRRKGWGALPASGADPDAGWDGTVPFDQMPHVVDPAPGYVATANNQPTRAGDGPFLGVDWADGYRLARILECLGGRRDWDVPGFMALQMDEHSIPWREMRGAVLEAQASTDAGKRALALLEEWDGRVGADSPGAAVFELFTAELAGRVARAKAPRAAAWALGEGFSTVVPFTGFSVRRVGHLARLLRQQPEGWLSAPWPLELGGALDRAARTLVERYGEDKARWAWGRVRTLTFKHPVGERRLLAPVFNRGPFPWGGDSNTISQAATGPLDPTANPHFVASLRMVVDVGAWDASRFCLPGGQSGNPLSPHYDDMLPLWRKGEGVPIAWTPDEVERATRTTLRLLPCDAWRAAESPCRGTAGVP